MKFQDLTGNVYGRLTVIERAENRNGRICWRCRCSCGNECVVRGNDLKSGKSQSCGCLRDEKILERIKTHGMSYTSIFTTWQGIKQRCYYPKNKMFPKYGGRGVKMHAAWINDFQAFYDYVSQLENFGEIGYTLDRIDNDGNYEPGNLRWATKKQQDNNKSTNIKVIFEDKEMTLTEAAEKSGIKYATLQRRHSQGDSGKDLFRPINQRKRKS